MNHNKCLPSVLFGLAMLTACSDKPNQSESYENVAASQQATTVAQHSEHAGHVGHQDTMPRPHRLAFMSGHVQAGLALYRAGELSMAAPHLLHPVSETHQAERKGLDELGFNAAVFEQVSAALDSAQPASEIEPLLLKAEENLISMAQQAGGDTRGIINFLMDTIIEEYNIAITDKMITDVGEYQDAFGFTVVAMEHAQSLENKQQVNDALTQLLALWSNGPVPVETPATPAQVAMAVVQVRAVL